MSRSSVEGRPSTCAARRLAHAWLKPWNPKRRMSHRSRHSFGTAYVAAFGGMLA